MAPSIIDLKMRRNGPKSSTIRNATPGRSLRRFWTLLKENSEDVRTFNAAAPDALALSIAGAIWSGALVVKTTSSTLRARAAVKQPIVTEETRRERFWRA